MVTAALTLIKTVFSEAIEIAHPSFITQRGLYLFLNGAEPKEQLGLTASAMLLVAENTLIKVTASAAAKVDETLKKLKELIIQEGDGIKFGGIKPAVFEGSTLFVYAIEVKIEV